jgi:uncharacterized membrane protein YccC
MSEMEPGRLEEFQREVEQLRLRGGGSAEPERLLAAGGIALMAVGVGMAVFANIATRGAENDLEQGDYLVLGLLGIAVALVGAVLWLRNSLSRYLRYTVIRLVYEDRAQTDRLLDALERIDQHLASPRASGPVTAADRDRGGEASSGAL